MDRQAVADALNKACDEVQALDQSGESDQRVNDATNLLVNLALGWLDDPSADRDAIIAANYGEDPEEVLTWI